MIHGQPTPPRGVPPSIPADASVLMGAVQVLDVLERLPAGATGAMKFAEGIVLMESGYICWAFARDMEHRLTQLLRAERASRAGTCPRSPGGSR